MIQEPDLRLTRLTYDPTVRPDFRVIGNVEHILKAECTLRNLSSIFHPHYALGGAAVGSSPEWALEHIGEYVCIGGRSIWVPSGIPPYTFRAEDDSAGIYTPFLIDWNGRVNTTFVFESQHGVDLLGLYKGCFDALSSRAPENNPLLIVTLMIVEAFIDDIVDKVLIVSPTVRNAPRNGRTIVHESNIEDFFLRNATRQRGDNSAHSAGQAVTIIIVGVGILAPGNPTEWDSSLVRRAFYLTPGVRASDRLMVHNHAVVLAVPNVFEAIRTHIRDELGVQRVATQLLETSPLYSMVHLEADTVLRRGVMGVGIIDYDK